VTNTHIRRVSHIFACFSTSFINCMFVETMIQPNRPRCASTLGPGLFGLGTTFPSPCPQPRGRILHSLLLFPPVVFLKPLNKLIVDDIPDLFFRKLPVPRADDIDCVLYSVPTSNMAKCGDYGMHLILLVSPSSSKPVYSFLYLLSIFGIIWDRSAIVLPREMDLDSEPRHYTKVVPPP